MYSGTVKLLVALLVAGCPCWVQAQSPASQPSGISVEVVEEDEEPEPDKAAGTTTGANTNTNTNTNTRKPDKKEAEEEEEVKEVVVITSTRTPQRVEEAPSIVSVITRQEILEMGYRSLGEVLRNVPGFGINDNGHWPDTGVRGINDRTTYGDKIQMLLDGHNMSWRQFNRNYHNPTWVAMEDISRVEVIRGPGAALWGANALTGVVNIVTRDWTDLDGAEVVAGADHRFASQFISARAGTRLGQASFYASLSYYADNADSILAPFREFQRLDGSILRVVGDSENGVTLALKARYKWFTFGFHKSRYDTNAPLSTFSVLGGDDSRFVTDRHIARVSFEKMLLPGFELLAQFDFDDYRFADGTVYEDNPGAATTSDPATGGSGRFLRKMAAADHRFEWKLQASYMPTLNFHALAGVELEYLDLTRWHFPEVWRANNLKTPEFSNLHLGAYLQGQYSPVDLLGITAGVRLDYDQIYGFVPTPRAGLVLRLPKGINLKGLFGMAYKAPSFHDLYYFRKNAYYGNPNLAPERSYTGELQACYRYPGFLDIRVTGFYTHIDNLIGYTERNKDEPLISAGGFPSSQLPDKTKAYNQKVNKQYVTSMGGELEVLVQPHKRITIGLQGTYRRPRDHNGDRLYYSARWVVGGSLSVRLHRHLLVTFRGLGVDNKQVKSRKLSEAGFPTWTEAQDPTLSAPPYFVGTFVLRAHDLIRDGIGLHLKLDNFTNGDYWDAGRELLYPQRRFQGMLWMTVKM